MAERLTKSLGVFSETGLLQHIVIGAGLLTLPGLAVESVGRQAVTSWLICGLAALPLVAVFVVLGGRHPDAGGIASYARRGLGELGERTASLLFLGAVIFGLPSIALTGGNYLAAAFGGFPARLALALLIGAIGPHLLPGEGPARAMGWSASTVIAAILVFLAIGLFGLAHQTTPVPIAHDLGIATAFVPFTMLLFAFTGWEVGAGIAEEFRRPERDFPQPMLLSFMLACALYLAVAFVAMHTDLRGNYVTSFVEIARSLFGGWGVKLVAPTAALIVYTNLSGAVWGVSRMVYGLARNGSLPAVLAATRDGHPFAAVAATVLSLSTVLLAARSDVIGLPNMLALAGQNFLVLYGIAACVLPVLARSWRDRALAFVVMAITATLLILQGSMLAYPASLLAVTCTIELVRRHRSKNAPVDVAFEKN